MLASTNKERLEQEIATLINFISEGRSFFFKQRDLSINSSDNFLNHFVSKDVFMSYPELAQLELNIQLLYIKLPSYYELIANSEAKKVAVRKARNAFAHELTDLMFNKRVKYNFFLHKVAENFKKVQFIFYEEDNEGSEKEVLSKTFDLELDKDINNFLAIWSQTRQKIDITEKVKIPALHPKTEKPS